MNKLIVIASFCLATLGLVGFMTTPHAITMCNVVYNLKVVKMEKEIWKDVKGYGDRYQVSNYGNVKSFLPIRSLSRNRKTKGRELILKQRLHGRNGEYRTVMLYKDKIAKVKQIHRLVSIAFIPNPENKRTVNHINGICDDNRLENLEWATDSEQMRHRYDVLKRDGSLKGKFGKNHHTSKKINQYTLDGVLIKTFDGAADAGRKLNLNGLNIAKAGRGLLKTAFGYKWKYYV